MIVVTDEEIESFDGGLAVGTDPNILRAIAILAKLGETDTAFWVAVPYIPHPEDAKTVLHNLKQLADKSLNKED